LQRFLQSGVDLSTKKSAEKAMKTLDRIFSRISAFAAERRPNHDLHDLSAARPSARS